MKIKQIHTNTQRIYAYTRKKEQKQIYGIPRLIFFYVFVFCFVFVCICFVFVCMRFVLCALPAFRGCGITVYGFWGLGLGGCGVRV